MFSKTFELLSCIEGQDTSKSHKRIYKQKFFISKTISIYF